MGLGFRSWGKSVFLLTFLMAWGHSSAAPTVFGRFTGLLKHQAIKRDQVAKLELIASREEGNTLFLKAILTLHFGDFKSQEYVSYHFDDVRFNLLTQIFVFDQADQPVTLVLKQTKPGKLEGQFRSAYSGDLDTVILSSEEPILPDQPLIEPVWGEYRGKCDSKISGERSDTVLQLYTYRSFAGAGQVGNPFRAYEVKGFLGENHGSSCLEGDTKMCVWGNISKGAYNFFKDQLQIFNNYRNLSCSTTSEGLKCAGCDLLKRVTNETQAPRQFTPPTSKSAFIAQAADKALQADADSIQGEYVGYVHHEYLNEYQMGSLNLLTYQVPSENDPSTLRMSAIASLYFGDTTSFEAIAYRFNERSFPNPLMAPQFVFSQPSADVDAMLQITSIGKGIVRGIWYSQVFGKVGEFEFHKSGLPALPADAKRFQPISGFFQGTHWEMDLMVGLGVSPLGTDDPFAPLTFGGYAIMPDITPKKKVTGGSYDFYTGRMSLALGDEIAFVGQRHSEKRLSLKKLYAAVTSSLSEFSLQPYRRVGNQ